MKINSACNCILMYLPVDSVDYMTPNIYLINSSEFVTSS